MTTMIPEKPRYLRALLVDWFEENISFGALVSAWGCDYRPAADRFMDNKLWPPVGFAGGHTEDDMMLAYSILEKCRLERIKKSVMEEAQEP